jgi:hypothetical protein
VFGDSSPQEARDGDYVIPSWPGSGLPLNLEALLRKVSEKVGRNIDLFDWPTVLAVAGAQIDRTEDCYERGVGAPSRPFGGAPAFHNLAVQGFDVADAWLVTPELCLQQIDEKEKNPPRKDDIFQPPSASFYRTAYNVLNPQRDPAKNGWSALTWLQHHAETQGVENLILWLGANNALGTVISLDVKATNGPPRTVGGKKVAYDPGMSRPERDELYNLWAPDHFAIDYAELMRRVREALKNNRHTDWRVFVGTVPAVSIAPLAKGVGAEYAWPDPFEVLPASKYYHNYTHVIFDEEHAAKGGRKLGVRDVYAIDQYIAAYNKIIRAEVGKANAGPGPDRFHVVDICSVLLEGAWKRNGGQPPYKWPKGVLDHFPMVDTRFYHATPEGHLEMGGLFGLDGVHPSAIGQGVIAHEFLKVMRQARPGATLNELDWDEIYQSDSLYQDPLRIMRSIRSSAGAAKIFLWVASALDRLRRQG